MNRTTVDVDRLLSSKLDSGLSVSTVQRIRGVSGQAIDQGMRWGCVNRNVARLSRSPKQERCEGRTLTYEQARRLQKELEGHRHEALHSLMLSTGLRWGEASGLKWQDFDETAIGEFANGAPQAARGGANRDGRTLDRYWLHLYDEFRSKELGPWRRMPLSPSLLRYEA